MKCVVICLLLGAALGGTSAEPVYENTFCEYDNKYNIYTVVPVFCVAKKRHS